MRAIALSASLPRGVVDPRRLSAPRSARREMLSLCYEDLAHKASSSGMVVPQHPSAEFVQHFTASTDFNELEVDLAAKARGSLPTVGEVAAVIACEVMSEGAGWVGGAIGTRVGGPAVGARVAAFGRDIGACTEGRMRRATSY